ncbi:acetate--CoA ligase [Candidatus Magnetaquicoccus inordinatus]|uniref:acetate--CoA ligase n=1 Tax=Candidatus Magnetaquicoccus inordinatus TaxID=2496818 RepID=UPI001D0EA781|nr:acetate--CoA ligase [Candidatus Magnetaquicoccus inordinatus]
MSSRGKFWSVLLLFFLLAMAIVAGVVWVLMREMPAIENDVFLWLQKVFIFALFAFFCLSLLLLQIWSWLDRVLIRPLSQLDRSMAIMANADPHHQLSLRSDHLLGELPTAARQLASALFFTRRQVKEALTHGMDGLERLERVIKHLHVGLVVINGEAGILLYNAAAQNLFRHRAEFLGLGRSFYELCARMPVETTMTLLTHCNNQQECSVGNGVRFFCAMVQDDRMLDCRMSLLPVEGGKEKKMQFVITLEEASQSMAALRQGDLLLHHGLENMRGPVANLRAAVEMMLLHPEMETDMFRQFVQVIHDEGELLSLFGGFSPESLKDRIQDAQSCAVITSDEGVRGAKKIPLRVNVDEAIKSCPSVHTVVTVRLTGGSVPMDPARDIWYHEAVAAADPVCPAEPMDAEDPLFILYTSGSTGKPKGVLHTTGGYLLYASITHRYVFDYQDGEVYWCTADVGWITGHSYIVYGPLANGATTLIFEGVPTYPDAGRFWQVIDKHQVNIFYTAPTAIRSLMAQGDSLVKKSSRKSLRLLGSVGEPINPEAWEWYYHVVGDARCPIVDTWWQTETGGIMITPLPGATPTKPGSATLPFFGIVPEVVDEKGVKQEGATSGILTITQPWPGMMRTVYGDHARFFNTYFAAYPGRYFPGDGCRRDEDGYHWITGRVDDIIIVSGHNLGTAEIESALVLHEKVAEAAVVGYPHAIKGQGIYAFVTLMVGEEPTDALRKELGALVRKEIGPIAHIDIMQWAPGLPKTRSGKIMRRILRKIASNELDSLGDTTTLADPSVVQTLINERQPT